MSERKTKRILKSASMLVENLGYAVRTRKPRLILKLVRNHLLARMGRLVPRSLCVAVDYRCNLACEHCSAKALDDTAKPVMTLEQYRSLAAQAERLGFFNIQFTGGEPLVRPDLEKIISVFRPLSNFIMISTNATLLDKDRIRSLKRAGVDVLSVSLDSLDPVEHDLFRGRVGTWQKTVDAVKQARRMGLEVSVSTVITHQNINSPELEELARFIRSLGCGMQLNWACPVGGWAGNREARLTERDMQGLFAFLHRHRHARTDFEGNYQHRGCPAVKEIMYVSAQGEFMPCAFIPISYGNVTEEPLARLRARALGDPTYQSYWNHCLSASNETFYENYLKPTFGRTAPLPYQDLEANLTGDSACACSTDVVSSGEETHHAATAQRGC